MTQSTPIQSLSLPTTANTTIRTALPDSDKPTYTIDCCLHCGSTAIKKIGKTKGGMQRYLCKDCHKSFTENYGLITHYSHLSEWQWQEAVRATVVGISITELAKNINVSTKTAWLCRMKIYDSLKNIYGFVAINISKLTGILTDDCFRFVPAPPSDKFDHIYTDQELYKAFNLPQKYIDVIEAVIKERK